MRLWHKDLICALPRQQLLGQWRECCCIARNLNVSGVPNHILVNKIIQYPISHFIEFASLIANELTVRGYKCNWNNFSKWLNYTEPVFDRHDIFYDWHDERYLDQSIERCYFWRYCGSCLFNCWIQHKRWC